MRIQLESTLALFALFALAFLGLSGGAAAAERCNGMKRLCDRHFDQVVLAGTHNAMSAESLGFQFPNQTVGIPGQLDGGIRALLLDTHYGRLQPDGTVRTDDDGSVTQGVSGTYLCHELCEIGATKLAPALRQIRKWLRHNPDETLLTRTRTTSARPTSSRRCAGAACSTSSTGARAPRGRRSGR